ncbi:MAG: hypothetical protein J1F10_07910, partial [Muribaculaceae bacterium]|nr:hypothetical protein [Muribaculaceae bacterium]
MKNKENSEDALIKKSLLRANENELFTRKVLNRLPNSKQKRTPYYLIEFGSCIIAQWICIALWICFFCG